MAVDFLISRGFTILDRNFHTRFGEIDIIALKENILHFVEVKYSKKYEAIYKIDAAKLRKIIKSADIYMSKKGLNMDYQFDAVITGSEIEFLENITF